VAELTAKRGGFLSTVPAGPGEVRIAILVLAISVVVFIAAAPFAKVQLPAVAAFLPAYQSALIITDIVTALLIFGQFAILRSTSLLVLACGYLFSALMATIHVLSFPGLFAEGGLISGGGQTTAWIYFLWHGGFPLFVVGYALLERRAAETSAGSPAGAITWSIAAVFAVTGLLVLLTTAGHDALPQIMRGDLDNSTKVYVATATWLVGIAALAVLWRRKQRTVLDVWLMVVMAVWAFDVALASVLNHGRFDVGWYAGRIYGLAAMSFILMVLLVEHSVLYARLIAAREGELREYRRAEEKTAELAATNRDLEAFSYSVSHDLRAPLRSIDGFSRVLQEDYAERLDQTGREHTDRIRRATQRMNDLIDDLLSLAKVSRADLRLAEINLGTLAHEIADTLRERAPDRKAQFVISEPIQAKVDSRLMRIALDNLLGNAWKFTSNKSPAEIEIGQRVVDGEPACYVRDNGAGFDMAYAGKLFQAFQRFHDAREFPGTGIGLAIVHRIVTKHGGRIWAESEPGKGTTFYFTLPAPRVASPTVQDDRGERRSAA
jgi:signal transduction histidine kinase